MSKFRRLSIEEAQNEFPLLNEETRKTLVGGHRLHQLGGDEQSVNDIVGICNNDSFNFDGGVTWSASSSNDDDFWDNYSYCSNSNHHTPIHWTEDCIACYNETLKYCNVHNHYVPLAGCYEWQIDKYTYCSDHGYIAQSNADCAKCDEEDFLMKYPDGCYKHGATDKYCSECEEEYSEKYPNTGGIK